jgi:hypothetical protein
VPPVAAHPPDLGLAGAVRISAGVAQTLRDQDAVCPPIPAAGPLERISFQPVAFMWPMLAHRAGAETAMTVAEVTAVRDPFLAPAACHDRAIDLKSEH